MKILYQLHSQISFLWKPANVKELPLIFSILSVMTINGMMNLHEYFIPFLQCGSAVDFSFIKQCETGVNFAPVSYK